MDQSPRRLALTKKVSLADVAAGWEDCFAIIRLATWEESLAYSNLDLKDKTPQEKMEATFDMVTSHFVSGKVKAYIEGNDEPQLVDMTAADIRVSVLIANMLGAEIMGFKLDPKGSSKAA